MSYGIYRQKASTVEAIRFTGDNESEVRDWIFQRGGVTGKFIGDESFSFYRPDGHHWSVVREGDWVVRMPAGSICRFTDATFHSGYELVV